MAGDAKAILGGTATAVLIGFVSVTIGLIGIPGTSISINPGTRIVLIIVGAIAFWLGLHFSSA